MSILNLWSRSEKAHRQSWSGRDMAMLHVLYYCQVKNSGTVVAVLTWPTLIINISNCFVTICELNNWTLDLDGLQMELGNILWEHAQTLSTRLTRKTRTAVDPGDKTPSHPGLWFWNLTLSAASDLDGFVLLSASWKSGWNHSQTCSILSSNARHHRVCVWVVAGVMADLGRHSSLSKCVLGSIHAKLISPWPRQGG